MARKLSSSHAAFSDYIPVNQTLTFEPSTSMISEQCVEIEIVNDSLAESWEIFSIQISADTLAVDLFDNMIDVYIHPDDSR